jgi:hypothetical protein
MKRAITPTMAVALCLIAGGDVEGRGFGGFGGFHAGGFGGYGGGYHVGGYGGYSGYHVGGYSGYHVGGYGGGYSAYHPSSSYGGYSAYHPYSNYSSGYRSGYEAYRSPYTPYRGGYSAYDRGVTGTQGTTLNIESQRAATIHPAADAAAARRAVNTIGPQGHTIEGYRQGVTAISPYKGAEAWRSAYAGTHFATDAGLARYSSFHTNTFNHTTNFWSHNYMSTHANYIRNNFNYYHCFHPGWWNRYPGCWFIPFWPPWYAWSWLSFPMLYSWWDIPVVPIDYDYGSNIVYQNNNVYVNGQDAGSAQDYAQQAITLADRGEKANAPAEGEWKPLGVFALVTGDEKTSNNVFQLAVNQDGVLRGNYYDGLMDSTTPVYGSVDKKTQRVAWTIGKKGDRVFEAGIYNLTKSEAPVLVHFGTDRTQQWLLVRVQQPDSAKKKE